MATSKVSNSPTQGINIRLTASERKVFKRAAAAAGCDSIGAYVRFLHSQFSDLSHPRSDENDVKSHNYASSQPDLFYKTDLGSIFLGDSRCWLHGQAKPASVDLIMTSPPFGLVRKKTYGNEDAEHYCDWFRPFADGFARVLKESGSLVIDIGGTWVPKQPTRSLYHFKLLVMLVEEFGFHLCQEHYWWNPSKLPTPAEWVNVRRVRVKDAVNTVWWLSKTPFPKANNKRVLAPYSRSMKALLKNGYKPKLRPSGHDISEKFGRDNGGSVPPNLLAIANTESNGHYQNHCRRENIAIHPARFPAQLPKYFIRFLTDPGDLIVDPFAGSCVTGVVAENLKRKWICCELSREYLIGGKARFVPTLQPLPQDGRTSYKITPPCVLPVTENNVPLFGDGGRQRPPSLRRNVRTISQPTRAGSS